MSLHTFVKNSNGKVIAIRGGVETQLSDDQFARSKLTMQRLVNFIATCGPLPAVDPNTGEVVRAWRQVGFGKGSQSLGGKVRSPDTSPTRVTSHPVWPAAQLVHAWWQCGAAGAAHFHVRRPLAGDPLRAHPGAVSSRLPAPAPPACPRRLTGAYSAPPRRAGATPACRGAQRRGWRRPCRPTPPPRVLTRHTVVPSLSSATAASPPSSTDQRGQAGLHQGRKQHLHDQAGRGALRGRLSPPLHTRH
jgi:hypothetical protein